MTLRTPSNSSARRAGPLVVDAASSNPASLLGVSGGASGMPWLDRRQVEGERVRVLRQRRVQMALLGLAISLPVHIGIIMWLASVYLPGTGGGGGPPSFTIEMSVMGDDELAESPGPTGDELAIDDAVGAPLAGEGPSTLEAMSPAIGLDGQGGGGSLEAGGAGPPGEGGGFGTGGGSGGLGPGGGVGGTSFFGVGGRGTRFCYIVDVSGSMSTGNRMQVAFDELKRSIGALPDFASFFVALYNDQCIEPTFQEGFQRAMPGAVTRIKRWLDEQSPMGGTEPGAAFERALALNPPPDLIFFLTDGEIPTNMADYLAVRNGANGKKKIVIHTIAFSSDASQDALRRIARESEGTFRFVPVMGLP